MNSHPGLKGKLGALGNNNINRKETGATRKAITAQSSALWKERMVGTPFVYTTKTFFTIC